MGSTEDYVVDPLEAILGPVTKRDARFPWAVGDLSEKTGRVVELPFDAFWQDLRLIVEVDEDQHGDEEPFFDHEETTTVSGVHRGEQRRLYDERKRNAARAKGLTVLVINYSRRRKHAPVNDMQELRSLLAQAGVRVGRK